MFIHEKVFFVLFFFCLVDETTIFRVEALKNDLWWSRQAIVPELCSSADSAVSSAGAMCK